MAKKKVSLAYKCSSCGYSQARWLGRCPECGGWNTMEECRMERASPRAGFSGTGQKEAARPVSLNSVPAMQDSRISTGAAEFDSVLGGGAMRRSAILVGGEPGIGKSTLLIQTAASVSARMKVLYVSGEESAGQIKSRADRLMLDGSEIQILCTTSLESVLEALDSIRPECVIVDSIQTVFSPDAGVVPGTVNQLKFCANELVGWVKERDSVLFMSAHVTKEGIIAGPRSLEHMVDTVISFERNNDETRFLRAQKNRFGSIDELGIFAMTERGLECVSDPSSMFLTEREGPLPAGIARAAVFEGSRVFLVEIQALTVPAKSSVTRVFSDKIDGARVSRVAAVIEKRAGIKFSDQDIYINVAGGVRLTESAVDGALAAALYSARTDIALPDKTVIVGELSLAGEIRPVGRIKQRVKTAQNLGFGRIFSPERDEGVTVICNIKDMVGRLFG